jgi:hypothetical protein
METTVSQIAATYPEAATSAHETRIPLSVQSLNQFVEGVHKAVIRVYPNRVTAVFDIRGREETAGAATMEELLAILRTKQEEHLDFIHRYRVCKRRFKEYEKTGIPVE